MVADGEESGGSARVASDVRALCRRRFLFGHLRSTTLNDCARGIHGSGYAKAVPARAVYRASFGSRDWRDLKGSSSSSNSRGSSSGSL
mmetsp:Transcript_74833/g.217226  ORF Transcript_74833/g.217226 Transcript_74833/m.217226 type:complete len:88 (+) Transcript_74833:478-741(+)